MTIQEAYEAIHHAEQKGSVLGLDSIFRLLNQLDNPQDDLRVIHLAGTNGKGSSLSFLSHILREAGYKTGAYSSPSILTYLERFSINGISMEDHQFASLATKAFEAVERIKKEGHPAPTVFEIETAIAFLYFKEEACDLVLIETGMGGDLDATNVMKEVICSVITTISMDHMRFLGNTLKEIASTKAGIICRKCPVVSAPQKEEAKEVLDQRAKEMETEVIYGDPDAFQVMEEELTPPFSFTFSYRTKAGTDYREMKSGLSGNYQKRNLMVVLEAIDVIRAAGYEISEEAVKEGIKKTRWHGRFETVLKDPLFIIDGAHNADGVHQLKETLLKTLKDAYKIFIFGVMQDKEHERMILDLMPLADEVYTVTPYNPRSMLAEDLAAEIKDLTGKDAIACETIIDGVEQAVEHAKKKQGVVISCGSLYYAGTVLKILNRS